MKILLQFLTGHLTCRVISDNELGKDEAWWLKAPRGKNTLRAVA